MLALTGDAMRRLSLALLVALTLACGTTPAPGQTGGGDRPRVVFVTASCAEIEFLCPPFLRALRRTGVEGRIVSPDVREDPVATLSLLAQRRHDLVIVDPSWSEALGTVAPRFPDVRFAVFDAPHSGVPGGPRNVVGIEHRANEAAYLAGWLAARLERRRPGPDVVGAVGGYSAPPVDDFIVGFRAGARSGSRGITVLTGYSRDFTDSTKCAAVARAQIARGAGAVFNVAGFCGLGTLRAARRAGIWGIGVNSDQSFLGPHVLTSVIKDYETGFVALLRGVRDGTLPRGGTRTLTLRTGGARLGRVSPRVPAEIRAGLERLRRRIVAGEVKVPGAT